MPYAFSRFSFLKSLALEKSFIGEGWMGLAYEYSFLVADPKVSRGSRLKAPRSSFLVTERLFCLSSLVLEYR